MIELMRKSRNSVSRSSRRFEKSASNSSVRTKCFLLDAARISAISASPLDA